MDMRSENGATRVLGPPIASLNGGVTRIAVLRALYLGDLLCAVPAWRALRAAYPDAHIALIGLPWARDFVSRFPAYLDEFIEFPGFPGLPERAVEPAAFRRFLDQLHQRSFDLILQMHGNGRYINQIVPLLGARGVAGFFNPGDYCPHSTFFMPYPDGISEVHRHLALMDFLGIELCGDELEYPLTTRDEAAWAACPSSAVLERTPYVCVHPGGRGATRRWPPERFAEVADVLAERGFRIVLTGTANEAALASATESAMRADAVNLVGQTDLGALGMLLRGARLLVANDTGVSHVAAALRVPSVIIVTGSDPARWAPLDRQRHRIHVGTDLPLDEIVSDLDALLGERCAAGGLP